MASYLPPTDILPIFNPTVFQSGDDTGITLSEADARFVKKSGSIMTGALTTTSLTTPLITLNGVNVGNELNKISSIETATTGITYDDTGDITTIDNNVTINNDLIVGTTNIGSSITTIENDVTDLETATTGITYDNTGNIDLTTIDNNVTINNDLIVGTTDIGSSISTLQTNALGITYNNASNTTTIDNNVTINNDLIVGTTNIGSSITTIENDVTDLETATTGITYDDTGDIDLTTISNNVLIGTNKYIQTPETRYFSETYKITTENPSQLALYAANTSNGSIGFYTGSDSGVGNETIKIDVNGNLTCRKGDLIVSGTNKTLSLPSHSDVDQAITDLETATTGITYASGSDTTTIDNNVTINDNLSLPSHSDVDQAITDLETATTGITYASGSDTTFISNNVILDRTTFSIEAPLISIGTEDIPVSIQTTLPVSTSSVTTAQKGTIHMSLPSGGTTGDGELGTGISFSRINTNRRGALIASFQDSSDRDRCGLKFFTKDTTTTGTDEVETEAMTISSSGNITAHAGLKVDGYIQKRYMRASNTDIRAVNGNTWGSTTPSSLNISYPSSFNSTGQRKTCDTNFLTESSGVFTFTEAGTYDIRVTFTAVLKTNVRHNVALYFSVNNDNRFPILTGSADERGYFGIAYCRDQDNVPANTCSFGSMYYFSANDTFRCKCLLDGTDHDSTWDDTLPSTELDMYIQYEFEKISDDDVYVRWTV